jgi:hypothetical protein
MITLLSVIGFIVVVDSSSSLSLTRRERFPSVEERVKLYASNWYEPPCEEGSDQYRWMLNHDSLTVSNITFGLDIIPDQTFYLTKDILLDCAREEGDDAPLPSTSNHIQFRHNMRMYCTDCVEMIDLIDHHLQRREDGMPILIQYGDSKTSHVYGLVQLPHFKKFRSGSISPKALQTAVTTCQRRPLETFHSSNVMQPIVWKLATHRHYRYLPEVFSHDTPWEKKKNQAIFRGQLTGARDAYVKHDDASINCQKMRRCRLVVTMNNNTYVDAKLTTTRGRLPDVVDGVTLVGMTITLREMMTYKGIIMMEGNDVASGLKWALLSQSIVLMPPPRHTSWCMEELLQPWVHYVPLRDDASDSEEKMKWVMENDPEARKISERATLWMEDLIFHPDAAREERLIKEELLRRYFAHFQTVAVSRKKK